MLSYLSGRAGFPITTHLSLSQTCLNSVTWQAEVTMSVFVDVVFVNVLRQWRLSIFSRLVGAGPGAGQRAVCGTSGTSFCFLFMRRLERMGLVVFFDRAVVKTDSLLVNDGSPSSRELNTPLVISLGFEVRFRLTASLSMDESVSILFDWHCLPQCMSPSGLTGDVTRLRSTPPRRD